MKVEDLLKPFPIKEFHPFPRAMMGPGAHEMVGPEALKMGFKRVLLMSSGLRGTDIVHNMAESLKWHGLEVVVYDQVESNPKDYNVMDSVKLYQENECDSFISIGGGSTHDACKGARISIAHDGRNVNDLDDDEAGDLVAAYGPNYRRLQQIKAQYDPNNSFRMNQNIRPVGGISATQLNDGNPETVPAARS